MTVDQRIEAAVRAERPYEALAALVHALSAEGMTKQAIGSAYHASYRRYQDADRDVDADAVADLLDVLTGWCSPASRILPDEPDVKT